jgi:hypothetical protein
MGSLIPILAPIIGDLIKRLIPDGDKSIEVEKEIKLALLEHTGSLEDLRGKIVLEEAKSSNWLTAAWRPLLMMVVVLIIACNYLLFPIVRIFYPEMITLELPQELWQLLTIGVGGYVVGRSGEKMVDTWSNNGGNN